MRPEDPRDDPFPRDDSLWRLMGYGAREVGSNVDIARTDRLVRGVIGLVSDSGGELVRFGFKREAAWGVLLGVAAAVAVMALVAVSGSYRGVNDEVNALASFAQVYGVDLSGGDQFLIAHLDELIETDVHALWLETTAR